MYVYMYVCVYMILTANRQFHTEPGGLSKPFVLNRPIPIRAYEFDLTENWSDGV